MSRPPSLADEILAALPSLLADAPSGVSVRALAKHLAADGVHVRKAMLDLHESRKALVAKRGKGGGFYLLPAGALVCLICHKEFTRKGRKSRRVTCSRPCAVSLAWRDEDSAKKRRASIRAEKQSPAGRARIAAHNRKRWAKPGERERLADWNRKRWRDPAIKAATSAAIQAVNGSPEARAAASVRRKRQWKEDPDYRAKTVAGVRKSKGSPEARAKFSKLLTERWRDPEKRKKYLIGVRRTAKQNSERMRGKKQSPEQIRKRVAARRKTIADRARADTGAPA